MDGAGADGTDCASETAGTEAMERDIDAEVAHRLLDFVERVSDLVGVCDEQGRVLYLNQAARKHLGVGAGFDLTTADFFAPEAFKSYYEEVRPTLLREGTWSGELAIRTQDGASIPMFFSVVGGVAPGAEITGLVTYGRPLAPPSSRAIQWSSSAWSSSTRDVGEIVDRSVVEEVVGTALARARQSGTRVALVCAELRSLAQLVDVHGSFVADGVVRAVGRRLAQTVRASDTVARIGRDTFVVLYENVRDVAEVLRLAQSAQATFEGEPIWTASGSGEVPVELTLGLAVGEPDDRPLELMLRAAAAVIESKSVVAREVVLAHEDGSAAAVACEALRSAITRGDIRTYAAPVVALPDQTVVGYDASARWQHPAVGALGADALSDLAARARIGPVIDLRVLREVVALAATSSGQVARRVYSSASEALLSSVYVEHHIREIADAVELSPELIFLVVDQHVVGERSNRIRDSIRSLRDAGCQFVLAGVDDRADGVDLLGDHGFRELRLSDHLTRLADVDAQARRRIGGVIDRAHDAGLRVMAGGVSTSSQHEALCELGCDVATGDYYGDAVAVDSIA